MKYSIIGGADGPTSVFLAGKFEMGWLNVFGLIIILLIMVPNIFYGVKFKGVKNKCENKAMNLLEQIGRYACMFLMIFNIGIAEFGFASLGLFFLYFFGSIALLLAYLIIWILFFHKQQFWKSLALAILPTLLFLLSGITMGHILLIISAVIFGVGHIYVTYENTK